MRIFHRLYSNKISHLIDTYSNFNPSPMSLKKLTDFGKLLSHLFLFYIVSSLYSTGKHLKKINNKSDKIDIINQTEIKSFQFLREELLVRLASMMKEMHYLPKKLFHTSSVATVYSWYMKSFHDIAEFRENDRTDEKILKRFENCANNKQHCSNCLLFFFYLFI